MLRQALMKTPRIPGAAAWEFKMGLKVWSHTKAGDKLRDLALLAMLNPTDYELSFSFMLVPNGGPERLKIWGSWLRETLGLSCKGSTPEFK